MPLNAEREEYYKEKIRDLLLKEGKEPTEEKVEQFLHDLVALAEIFIESKVERRRKI